MNLECSYTGKEVIGFVPSYSYDTQLSVLSPLPNGVFAYYKSALVSPNICLSSQLSFLGISQDSIFHTKNLQRIWIPPPFCNPTSICYHLSKICPGYGSGEVLVLEVCVHHSESMILFILTYSFRAQILIPS